jgi:hypothetical protein
VLGWIGKSRGKGNSRNIKGRRVLITCRINLETGEQTVLSTHDAPVKSVVYSKEHCNFRLSNTRKLLTPSQPS